VVSDGKLLCYHQHNKVKFQSEYNRDTRTIIRCCEAHALEDWTLLNFCDVTEVMSS
jgi:uncharacterized radical SAM superfamily Fe-S cluster-containing enzyme